MDLNVEECMFIGDLYQSSHGLWWWLPLTQLPTGDAIVVCVGFCSELINITMCNETFTDLSSYSLL